MKIDTIEYSSHFERVYRKLNSDVRRKAERQEKIFRGNPFDSRLKTHKLHGKLKDFYAFSIDKKNRIAFRFSGRRTVVFLDAGDHAIYQ